jgi:hypothetical protein
LRESVGLTARAQPQGISGQSSSFSTRWKIRSRDTPRKTSGVSNNSEACHFQQHANFRARRNTGKVSRRLGLHPGGPANPSPPYSKLGVESSFGSVWSNFLPVCEAASKGSILSPRGHRRCEEVEHFGPAWQVGTFGSAAGCKRGLAMPGFRRRDHEHGVTAHELRKCRRTDLHPAYRPSAALDSPPPPGSVGQTSRPHRAAGAVQVQRGLSSKTWKCGSNFPPARNLEADGRRFLPLGSVGQTSRHSKTCEDGANTVLHPPAETAWLSILTTFAPG